MNSQTLRKKIEENFIFDDINLNIDGDSAIFRLNNYCGQILLDGKIDFVIAAEDINYVDGKLWAVKKHGQWGVVHRNELTKWIIKPRYDDIRHLNNNYFIVEKYHKYGIINTDNKIVLDFTYEKIYAVYIDENKFIAKINGRYGIIDINGKVIAPFIYDEIDFYYLEGRRTAALNGKHGIIDTNGNLFKIDKKELTDMIKLCE
ncbi:WG repeat-containing protein, partial [bacterium]|nr:WG repeat-containing protein [bacterium]